jgi:hypothetical protein
LEGFVTNTDSASTCVGTTAPTDEPTASPTKPPTNQPTAHPCDDGSHDCNLDSTYCAKQDISLRRLDEGIDQYAKVLVTESDIAGSYAPESAEPYTCECLEGFVTDGDSANSCLETTAPSAVPTLAPSAVPTFFYESNYPPSEANALIMGQTILWREMASR